MADDKEYLDRIGVESDEPRAYTPEEVREQILTHMRGIAKYWATVDHRPCIEKVEGAMFSVLTMLDGATDLPAFDLTPCPHESDKDYYIKNGENWYDNKQVINECQLHEEWHRKEREENETR